MDAQPSEENLFRHFPFHFLNVGSFEIFFGTLWPRPSFTACKYESKYIPGKAVHFPRIPCERIHSSARAGQVVTSFPDGRNPYPWPPIG